jgi:hypothetical protein
MNSHIRVFAIIGLFIGNFGLFSQNLKLEIPNKIKSIIEKNFSNQDIEVEVYESFQNDKYLFAGTLYPDKKIKYGNFWYAITDTAGKIIHQKQILGDRDDRLQTVLVEPDGFILAGNSTSTKALEKTSESYGMKDFWVIKFDRDYNIVWQQSFGGNRDEELGTVIRTNTGYTIGGSSQSEVSGNKTIEYTFHTNEYFELYNYWIVETDFSGNVIRQKDIGKNNYGTMYDFYGMKDGGYLLKGVNTKIQDCFGCEDIITPWLIRLDSLGNIVWTQQYHDLREKFSSYHLFTEGNNGKIYLAGTSSSDITDKDYAIVCLDMKGNWEWDKTFGGSESDELNCIYITSQNKILLGGSSNSDKSGDKTSNCPGEIYNDFWIIQLAENGGLEWQTSLGGYENEVLIDMAELQDKSIIIGGISNSDSSYNKSQNCLGSVDFWFAKIGTQGNILWDKTMGGKNSDILHNLLATTDGGLLIIGDSENSEGDFAPKLIKINALGEILWSTAFPIHSYTTNLLQDSLGNIYVHLHIAADSYNYNGKIIKISPTGEIMDNMLIASNFFLLTLPVYFIENHSIIIGKNEILIEKYPDQSSEIDLTSFSNMVNIFNRCFEKLKE